MITYAHQTLKAKCTSYILCPQQSWAANDYYGHFTDEETKAYNVFTTYLMTVYTVHVQFLIGSKKDEKKTRSPPSQANILPAESTNSDLSNILIGQHVLKILPLLLF